MKFEKGKTGAQGDAAMSFDEIGRALGITRGGAWMAYKSGMRKLRRRSKARVIEELRDLAAAMQSGRR